MENLSSINIRIMIVRKASPLLSVPEKVKYSFHITRFVQLLFINYMADIVYFKMILFVALYLSTLNSVKI